MATRPRLPRSRPAHVSAMQTCWTGWAVDESAHSRGSPVFGGGPRGRARARCGLLDSAAHRPGAGLYGHEAYADLDRKAAALLASLVGNHTLVDGNNCLGWLAVVVFYGLHDSTSMRAMIPRMSWSGPWREGTCRSTRLPQVLRAGIE